jgi:hypothetical protein
MMQKLEGDFAQYYNRRKRRRGAFWEDRFHATMIGEEFEDAYRREIAEAIASRRLQREPWWTESIAVGEEEFVQKVKEQTRHRRRLEATKSAAGALTRRARCRPRNVAVGRGWRGPVHPSASPRGHVPRQRVF